MVLQWSKLFYSKVSGGFLRQDSQRAINDPRHTVCSSLTELIMKITCPPGFHHNGFVRTPALGHIMCSCVSYYGCMSLHKAIVVMTGRAHGFSVFIHDLLLCNKKVFQIKQMITSYTNSFYGSQDQVLNLFDDSGVTQKVFLNES